MNKPLAHAELEIGRIQPHNIELEQQVLGALLISNDAFHRIGSPAAAQVPKQETASDGSKNC